MTDNTTTVPTFSIGQVLATPGALDALAIGAQTADQLLSRHLRGDWGVVCQEDREANDAAILDGSRLLSAYKLKSGIKIWIITEAADDQGHRPATTLLLPEEY